MPLDPTLLLSIAALVLAGAAACLLRARRVGQAGPALVPWGLAFAAAALGFVLVLGASPSAHSPARFLGNALLLLAPGLQWAGARRFGGRPVRRDAAAAGAAVWLVLTLAFDPAPGWRVAGASLVTCAYATAAARELAAAASRRRGPSRAFAALAGRVMAAHAGFFGLRALAAPVLGYAAGRPALTQGWGALLAIEAMVFAGAFGALAVAMAREGAAVPAPAAALDDPLTGVGNARALARSGDLLLASAGRAGRPAALLLMGLDGLDAVNARHGRDGGDRLLAAFARLAHAYLPPTSLVCRIEGDLFAAVLPGADGDRARSVADEIRALFGHLAIEGRGAPLGATVSIGVAMARAGEDVAAPLARAALALEAAKAAGRDRVAHEGAEGAELRPAA